MTPYNPVVVQSVIKKLPSHYSLARYCLTGIEAMIYDNELSQDEIAGFVDFCAKSWNETHENDDIDFSSLRQLMVDQENFEDAQEAKTAVFPR